MKRSLLIVAVFVLPAVASAVAYQAAARERDYRTLLASGETALHDDQTIGAIEAYSGAIALRPDSMLAHLRRGEAYQQRAELDEAARDFRTAAALDPTATRPLEALGDVMYQLQWYQRAADIYTRDLRLDDRSANVSYKLALALYRNGNVDQALTTLSATLGLNNRMVDAYYLQGLCLRDKHRNTEAARAFEQAVALDPRLIAAREELSDLYAVLGRHTEQIEQLQAIAGLDRGHVDRQVAIGVAQARAGNQELAITTLGNTLERTTDQDVVYRALGKIWLDRAQAQHNDRVYLSKALEALGRTAASPSATSDLLTLYGRALLLDGQLESAERVFQQASTRYPLEPASLSLYATVAERQAHFDVARKALIDYTGVAPDEAGTASMAAHIAALSMTLHDPATAVVWLQRALALTPDDIHLFVDLAEAQLRGDRQEEARLTIARALEKDPIESGVARARSARLLAARLLWIGRVAKAVSDEVEPEDEQRNREARHYRQVRCIEQMRPSSVEHGSPARRRRLHPESEKTERRLANDRPRHSQRRLNNDGRNRAGNHVAPEDTRRACAKSDRGLHVFERARTQHLSPHKARIADPPNHGQRQQHVRETRTKHGDERNREEQSGEREQRVDHPADNVVHRPTPVAGNSAQKRTDDSRDDDDSQPDGKGDAGPGQHPRENVAAKLVESKRVGPARPGESHGQLLGRGIKRREPRTDDGRHGRHQHNHGPGREQRVAARSTTSHG